MQWNKERVGMDWASGVPDTPQRNRKISLISCEWLSVAILNNIVFASPRGPCICSLKPLHSGAAFLYDAYKAMKTLRGSSKLIVLWRIENILPLIKTVYWMNNLLFYIESLFSIFYPGSQLQRITDPRSINLKYLAKHLASSIWYIVHGRK